MNVHKLFSRCKAGDQHALHLLYEQYRPRLLNICRQYTKGDDVAEDLLHDAYVVILTSLDQLRDADKLESWMATIVRNVGYHYKIHLDKEHMLPDSGMLSFFYDLDTMKWGFEPDDLNAARVFYFPEISELRPGEFPEDLPEEFMVTEFQVNCYEHISIPEYSEYKEYFGVDFQKWDEYDECSAAAGYDQDEWGNYSKLLGYADVIQGPMQEECESLMRGYRRGCPEDYAAIPPEVKLDIKEKAKDWVLLFQMGTIETDHYELMFGDCGHIYFWIRKEDLANKNFEKAWLILQCS